VNRRGAVFLVWTLWAVGSAQAAELRLRHADGRTGAPMRLEHLDRDTEESFVNANDLAGALGLARFWRPELGKLVLKVGDRRIQVTVDTRLVLDGEAEVLLRVPIRYRQGSVWLPLECVERILVPALGAGTRLDRQDRLLSLGEGRTDVAAIEYERGLEGTRIRIRCSRPLAHRARTTSAELLRVDLDNARLDPVVLIADAPAPLVRSVRAEQGERGATLYFRLSADCSGFTAVRSEDERLIVLDLTRRPAASLLPVAPARAPDMLELSAATDSFDVLVLDAGHGGEDPGVRAGGAVEKDIVLTLAFALQSRLERDLGVRVVLVREDDATLTSERRAEIANRARGDLAILLHANAAFGSEPRGFEILHAPVPPEAETMTAAARMTDFRPWRDAQRDFAAASRRFAETLQTSLETHAGIPSRGVRGSDLLTLRGYTMPVVQLEVGFLSHAGDVEALSSPDFAAAVAAALVEAIRNAPGRGAGVEPSPEVEP
jgi:N-acetylmuramoyl-L-alanine amidase